MKVRNWFMVMALGLGLSLPASLSAQTTGQAGTVEGTQAGPMQPGQPAGQDPAAGGQDPATAGQPPATAPAVTEPFTDVATPMGHQWIASGFVGANFGDGAEDTAGNVGGSIGYLWNGWFGTEFAAGFTPNFQHRDGAFLADNPAVNTYMVNAVGAMPMGVDGQWQPFVSAGLGAMTLRSDILGEAFDGGQGAANIAGNENSFAGNIGVGLMTFAGNWGIRGDVRYFRAFGTQADNQFVDAAGMGAGAAEGVGAQVVGGPAPPADGAAITAITAGDVNLLDGLGFWRANIGIAFRW
jgi:hypothetical protein